MLATSLYHWKQRGIERADGLAMTAHWRFLQHVIADVLVNQLPACTRSITIVLTFTFISVYIMSCLVTVCSSGFYILCIVLLNF